MASMKYAGIGSRAAPSEVLEVMTHFAAFMARKGHVLHTGGAAGADSAFMLGAERWCGPAEIYLPWPGYRTEAPMLDTWKFQEHVDQAALDLAAKFHPNWAACGRGPRALHARNGYIVLGPNLNDPVSFVVAWTPGGLGGGGTGQALRIAKAYNIPVVDLGQYSDRAPMGSALNAAYAEYCA